MPSPGGSGAMAGDEAPHGRSVPPSKGSAGFAPIPIVPAPVREEPIAPARRSDLGVRFASALVMLAVAGGAFWLGGRWWLVFVGLIGVGVLLEWAGLVFGFVAAPFWRGLWLGGGLIYVGVASAMLLYLRQEAGSGYFLLPMALVAVIATDVGAYFAGRTIGGPRIAPRISPAKTWAGLGGGMVLAGLGLIAFTALVEGEIGPRAALGSALFGAMAAIVAQAGDFFESWMKRRAGVKDSGRLIPGHGGLLDRLDGLLAVMFVLGLLSLVITLYGTL